MGAEIHVSTAAASFEGEAEHDEVGPSRISVKCPSINKIKSKITDLIRAVGARDLFRTDYEQQDRNRILNSNHGSEKIKVHLYKVGQNLSRSLSTSTMMTEYLSVRASSESDENFTSASETYGYYAERSSTTLTSDYLWSERRLKNF